jgi:LPXTG-site transpeptidase (sortase) family protein
VVLVGGVVIAVPWIQGAAWQHSPEAARAARNEAAPQVIRITPAPTVESAAAPGSTVVSARPTLVPIARTVTAIGGGDTTLRAPAVAATPTPVPVPSEALPALEPPTLVATPTPNVPSDLQLAGASFQFMDPPQPGAGVRLSVSVNNPTDEQSGPVRLTIPLNWLNGYQLLATDPPVVDGRQTNNSIELAFDGPEAQSTLDVKVDFVTTDEVIDAPLLTVTDAEGRQVGRTQPPTEAPPAQPGPIYSIDIPNLKLHAGVVPVDWEPPLFVVGQVRGSAYVTEGNSVLVGHVRGAAGYNVFDQLDRLSPGDAIVASSRGEQYHFVVSDKQVLPEDDTSPVEPTTSPRLTLMTCAGTWNPITQDYSERLWVIAEPVDAVATPTPAPVSKSAPVAPIGGLGTTDSDLTSAFGKPAGETAQHLAVYKSGGEHRAQLVDIGDTRRAVMVAQVPATSSPLMMDAAHAAAKRLLPNDAKPRGDGKPEGNSRFVVERYSSQALADLLPASFFTDRHGSPGDVLVVYERRPDGRIAAVLVGIGDDAQALLNLVP